MDAKTTSHMVTMGYAAFFGRYPENDAVVQEKTGSQTWMVIADFICCEEFENHVLPGIFDSGRPLPHEQLAPTPTPDIVAFAEQLGCLGIAQEFPSWPHFLRHVLTAACENVVRGVSSLEPQDAVAVLLRIQRLIFSIFRHMAAAPAPSMPFEEFGNRLEHVATQALARAEACGREVDTLRNALNEAVWRTERSYLDLSEGLAGHGQRLHGALERADALRSGLDELHGGLGALNHQLDARIAGFDQKLQETVAQAVAGSAASGRELGALRDALNDTVWRAERSYLGLAEGLADQGQQIRVALERADELHSGLGALNHQLDARIAGFDQKLQETVAQAVAGSAASGRELGALRDALNDTVWRAERSYLGLAEGLADQGQQIRVALERADELHNGLDELHGGLGALNHQLDARVDAVKATLSEAMAEVHAGLAALDERLADAGTRAALAALEERLTAQDAALANAVRSWQAVEAAQKAALDAVKADAAGRLEAARKAQAEENAALEQRLLLRMGEMQAVQAAEIQSLRQQVETAEAARQAAEERVVTLTAALGQLGSQQAEEQRAREAALEALSTRLGTVQESTRSALSAEIDGASAQARKVVDELQAVLNGERAGRQTLEQTVAALSERLPALREEIAAEVAGISAETRRSVEEMAGKLGQDMEKAGTAGNALEALTARLDALQGGVDTRLQSMGADCDDARSAIAEIRSAVATADQRAAGASRALDSVFRIISQEIRPLGLLFPFNAEPDSTAAEQYKEVLGNLKTESVSSCTVCGSTSSMPYGFVDGFSLHRCTDCNFIFPNPRVAESELEVLYSAHYWEEHQQLNGLAGLRERLLFDYHYALPRLFMIKGFRPTGRLLDIGCAAGALVRRAQEFGYKSVGMEVNSQIAAFGQDFFNVKIITGKIETARLSRRSFDVVTMFDVFEHLYEPEAVLRRIHDILDRNGLLVIETFRTDCPDFERDPLKHPDCKPLEHIGMYREEHIDKIIERNSYKIIETRYPQGSKGSRVIKFATKI